MVNLQGILKKYFGYDNFRKGQEEIIRSIVNCSDTLVIMPTGGGKSICYQLPSIVMPGVAIVISPLIALMKDQVDALQSIGIPATYINSSVDYSEVTERFEQAAAGAYKMIYIAPERLESKQFLRLLGRLSISFLAVDEAHCISEWGHDFRPAYLFINKIFDYIERVPVIALTATATPDVQDDIAKTLKLEKYNKFVKGFDRPNLNYMTETTKNKTERIIDIISTSKSGSTMIYCGSRKRVELYTAELQKYKIKAEPYHAGMKQQIRDAVQDRFIKDRTKIVVATNAFGMGIDKPDVRNVIHLDLTSTLEAYYQEAGRAGRDGLPANCTLIYSPEDINLQEFFIKSTYPNKTEIIKLYRLIKDNFDNAGNNSLPAVSVLANQSGLSIRTTTSILNIFERNGFISKGNFAAAAQIRFTSDRERIVEYYENTTDNRKVCLEALLRSVPTDAFSKSVSIDIKSMLFKHNIKRDIFDEAIKAFDFSGLIELNQYDSENAYIVNSSLLDDEALPFDFKEFEKRRVHALKKLEKVVEYAETSDCKRNFILKYFDETDINDKCGRCSSCTNYSNSVQNFKSRERYLEELIIKAVFQTNEELTSQELLNFLKGKNTKIIKLYGYNNNDLFGKAADFSEREITEVISKMTIKRLLEYKDSKSKIINITNFGKIRINQSIGA